MKVYGIIVAYNPTQEEIEGAIARLENQCDLLIIANNSDNGSVINNLDKHKLFNFGENLGIAKAQSVAMEWAFNNGADFIIQMDQDSILEDNTVFGLIESYHRATDLGIKVGVIGPRHYDKVTNEVDEGRLIKGESIKGTDLELIHATISSASLISKAAYEAAGGMDDSLFIDSVDWEYCWRLKKLGFSTLRVNSILLGHRVGDGKKSVIGSLDVRVPSPIRHYYHTRNLFLLTKRGYVPFYWKLSNYVKLLFKLAAYPFIFKDGSLRFKYLVKGIADGLLGKSGRIDIASKDPING